MSETIVIINKVLNANYVHAIEQSLVYRYGNAISKSVNF